MAVHDHAAQAAWRLGCCLLALQAACGLCQDVRQLPKYGPCAVRLTNDRAYGAYDADRRRVLLLDPDRQWYEPYWVPEDKLLSAMATADPVSGKQRGLIWVIVSR